MGKKMKLPNFLSKINTDFSSSSSSSSSAASSSSSLSRSSWSWPVYCQQPKTLSFRTNDNAIFIKNIDNNTNLDLVEKTNLDLVENTSDSLEIVIKDLRSSERLFFEPEETSSILEQVKNASTNNKSNKNGTHGEFPFKESSVLSMDSQDPYLDFKKSMEEMVEAHGIKDWEDLEELLSCYLKVNGKSNHGYIIGAFVDLLLGLAFASCNSSSVITATTTSSSSDSCCCNSCSPSSPLSFYTSSFSDDCSSTPNCVSSLEVDHHQEEIHHLAPCLSSLEAHDNEIKEN